MDSFIVARFGSKAVECRETENGWTAAVGWADDAEEFHVQWTLPGLYYEAGGHGGWWRFDRAVLVEGDDQRVRIELMGQNDDTTYSLEITGPEDDGRWRLSAMIDAKKLLIVGRLEIRGRLAMADPDFVYTPNLRPEDDEVIGDHSYRALAAVLQKGSICFAAIPDLDTLAKHRPIPTALDLDLLASEPYLSHGFCTWEPRPHVYYRHGIDLDAELKPGSHEITVFVDVVADAELMNGYRKTVRDLWARWGTTRLADSIAPQRVSFEQYARYAYEGELSDSFREFELGGMDVGGVLINREYPGDIWNQAWFSDMRSACGMMLWAKRWGDDSLRDKARRIVNLALSAPQDRGLFPNIYVTERGDDYDLMLRGGQLVDFSSRPSYSQLVERGLDDKGFADDEHITAGWIGSQTWGGAPDWYSTVDMSWTACWLLKWDREIEPNERIAPYLSGYADRLCQIQANDGSIPSYLHRSDQSPLPRLERTASSSASGSFLAALGRLSNEAKYLDAARRVARFVEQEVLPEQKWFDYETFYSCSRKSEKFFDHHTGQHPQNTLSMLWTARMYLELWRIDGDAESLESACAVADYLALYQQVWDVSFLRLVSFGGFAVQNTDGEWNDARQCYMATLFCELGEATGIVEYKERGLAALRASFALICCPENEPNYGELQSEHLGWCDENYAHGGENTRAGHSSFSWGSGSAAASAVFCAGVELD